MNDGELGSPSVASQPAEGPLLSSAFNPRNPLGGIDPGVPRSAAVVATGASDGDAEVATAGSPSRTTTAANPARIFAALTPPPHLTSAARTLAAVASPDAN